MSPSDLLAEDTLTIAEAARKAKTHPSRVYSWIKIGLCDGVRLEACLCGSKWLTSEQALSRFFDRLTAARLGRPTEIEGSLPRTEAQRRRDSEAAARECAELGLGR